MGKHWLWSRHLGIFNLENSGSTWNPLRNLSWGTWRSFATLRIQNNPTRNKSKSQNCANILKLRIKSFLALTQFLWEPFELRLWLQIWTLVNPISAFLLEVPSTLSFKVKDPVDLPKFCDLAPCKAGCSKTPTWGVTSPTVGWIGTCWLLAAKIRVYISLLYVFWRS